MDRCKMRLFVTGLGAYSMSAVSNVRALATQVFQDNFDLDIIDILENPELAEQERIIVTPTLIKDQPPPEQRLLGDLSQRETVIQTLKIGEKK